MDRREFIAACTDSVRTVREEFGFSQERMAAVLGISKKTLIQVEKGRAPLSWAVSVALCTIFEASGHVLQTFGGPPGDLILLLAFERAAISYPRTMGGRVWWKTVREENGYTVQQNILSHHYRLLDAENRRLCASFDGSEIEKRLKEAHTDGEG